MKHKLFALAALATLLALGCDEDLYNRLSKNKKKEAPKTAPATGNPKQPEKKEPPATKGTETKAPVAAPKKAELYDGYADARFGMSYARLTAKYKVHIQKAQDRLTRVTHHLKRSPKNDLLLYLLDDKLFKVEHVKECASPEEARKSYDTVIENYTKKYGLSKPNGYWSDGVRDLKVTVRGPVVTVRARVIAEDHRAAAPR